MISHRLPAPGPRTSNIGDGPPVPGFRAPDTGFRAVPRWPGGPSRRTLEAGIPEVIVMMHTTVGWHVEMEFNEDEEHTRAAALLRLPDGTEVASSPMVSEG